jgi:hypothetical protein
MKRLHLFLWMSLMLLAISGLAACGPEPMVKKVDPATVKDIEGSDLKEVILTAKAAERIGVQTVPANGMVIPYSAVIYDTQGNSWIYTSPSPLTFIRAQVAIDYIEGDQVFLAQELQTEAPIVTVGVAELFGAETGISK